MMELLSGFPDDVLAIRASGRISRADYETVLIPAAMAAFKRHEKLRVYYELAGDFEGFDIGAMWEDMTFGVGHWSGWGKVAMVTGETWLQRTAHAFGFFMPCPVKIFTPDEAAAARQWVSEAATS